MFETLDPQLTPEDTGRISQLLGSRSDHHKALFGTSIVSATEEQRFLGNF